MNDSIEQEALKQLESYLQLNRKTLKDFPNMSLFLKASGFLDSPNGLIQEEMSYDIIKLQSELHQNIPLLNENQCAITTYSFLGPHKSRGSRWDPLSF